MRGAGNTPYFRPPKTRGNTNKRMLVIVLLTVLLPPFGLICLWRGSRYPLRGKILLSILGVLSMTFFFTLYLGRNVPEGVNIPVDYKYLSVTPTPAPIPTVPQNGADGTPAPAQMDGVQTGDEASDMQQDTTPLDGVAPANPVS